MESSEVATNIRTWHLSFKEVLAKLCSNPDEGLTEKEVRKRLQLYGHNVLKTKKNSGTLRLLLIQFNMPLIYLLIFAASLSLLLYDNIHALLIFGIIFISAFLSFILSFMPFAHQFGFTILQSKFYLFIAIIVGLYVLCVELAEKKFLKHGLNKF